MNIKLIATFTTFLAFTACSGQLFTFPSPALDSAKYENLGEASETATGIHLFGFIPIGLNDKIERATKAAVASRGGDELTNITIRERWYWAYILNIYKVDVSGTVVKKRSR